jgi:uncharacterized membrane protein YkvA (DUF1232 family)
MFMRWRLLSACQFLLGSPAPALEQACLSALQAFVTHGPGISCDHALDALAHIITCLDGSMQSVLPTISSEKRRAVSSQLKLLADGGPGAIEKALSELPCLRQRMSAKSQTLTFFPGIKHRFELVATILEDPRRSDEDRGKAAAGLLYLHEPQDVIPDTTHLIGMMDDDYSLRLVLEDLLHGKPKGSDLHWSEKVCSIWYDMPFLVGMNLQREGHAIPVGWLDRLNSYVSCFHALRSAEPVLLFLQPSVSCSPLHPITSLVGLLILDALTSANNRAQALRVGHTYEVDGAFWVKFEGISDMPATPGWLRLRVRNGVIHQPPELVDHMVPVDDRRLSTGGEFSSRSRSARNDYLRRFFNWNAPIGAGSLSSHLVLVTSQQRALELLDGVQSNGVQLLNHGLVRFFDGRSSQVETYGTLVIVAPSLSAARQLLQRGVQVQAIVVDGYERLYRGRHDLPFITNRKQPPPIICWSASGYFPATPPTWLPSHICVEVSRSDLSNISELDHDSADPASFSVVRAATSTSIHTTTTPPTADESELLAAIDTYADAVRSATDLPEYWHYHLLGGARTLRVLITATTALWSDIEGFASRWTTSVNEKWASLRTTTVAALSDVRKAEMHVLSLLKKAPDGPNSRARALLEQAPGDHLSGPWYIVCDEPEQQRVIASFVRSYPDLQMKPVLLRQLPIRQNCIVAGWSGESFARRLMAHSPGAIFAVVEDRHQLRWNRAAANGHSPAGQSLLSFANGHPPAPILANIQTAVPADTKRGTGQGFAVAWDDVNTTPCVFLWLSGEPNVKVVPRDARIIVKQGDLVRERLAVRLQANDHVILGSDSGRWSPADEFTEALVKAVEASHPELVHIVREWRRALSRFRDAHSLSTAQLRARLEASGVSRHAQTLDGWLQLDRASPIAPKGLDEELATLWPLIDRFAVHSLKEVIEACSRLRALRGASGRALLQAWKGRTNKLGIDEAWIAGLVGRLRQEVQAYEIEALTLGDIPPAMLGWWVPPEFISRFESSPNDASLSDERVEEQRAPLERKLSGLRHH